MSVRIELHTSIRLYICISGCVIGGTAISLYDYPAIPALVHTVVCPLQRIAVPTYCQPYIHISGCLYG
jgi:hypothetical protein